MLKILNLFLLIIFNFLLSAGIASATDCAKVNRVDNKINFDGALNIFLGCEIATKDKISHLQKNPDNLIRLYFIENYYSGPFQPNSSTTFQIIDEVNNALNNKSLSTFFYMKFWVDTDNNLQDLLIGDFNIQDDEVYDIFELIMAAESILWEDSNFYWALDTLKSMDILLSNKQIPFASDFISYAYLNGIGVRTNINTAIEYNEYAGQTLAEAVRFRSTILEDQGASLEERLNNTRKAAKMNYIYGIIDLGNLLFSFSEHSNQIGSEYSELFSTLEILGYSGNQEIQYLIAQSYDDGIGVSQNLDTALEWYERAANSGSTDAASYLMSVAAEEGNYNSYLVYALMLAKWGYVETDGYLDAINAIHILNKPNKTKIIQFLLDHCIQNPNVNDFGYNICKNYPVKHAKFKPNQDLILAINDPEAIEYKDSLNLVTGDYHALLIGNQNYNYWSKLETPIQDIDVISNKLRADYSFKTKIIKDASRKEILQSIYDLGSTADFNDHVLVYYAGHGIVDTDTDEGYWIPSNADQSFRPDWVSNSEIKTALKSIKSKHLLVMADSCYSGTLVRSGTRLQNSMSNPLIKRLFSKKAKIAITSGGNEPVVDSISGSKNSIFANAFLDALENNSDIFVPASILFASIRDKVTKEANQTPLYSNIRELDDDGGEFVFKKNN